MGRTRGPGGRHVAALLVVAGLLTAAAALRPEGGLLGTAATGPVGAVGFVVLIGIGWAALVGRFAVRFREEVRHLAGPTPRAERLREAAMVLLPLAAAAVPVLLLVLHGRTAPAALDAPQLPPPLPLPDLSPTPTPPPPPVKPADDPGFGVLFVVLVGSLALAAVAAFVFVLVRALRHLRIHRRPATPPLPTAPAGPEAALAEAVASGRRALEGDDARAAVIACYAAMEGSLAASGLPRQAWESPTELLERALSDDRVDPGAARALTALFREARYSTHPMDDARVRRARTALDAIAARLAATDPAGADAAPTAGAGATAAADAAGAPGGNR
ncbi:DUF4129 domain-containing protein [Kitasatospora sp. NPDC101176]|uniref:DUF4129 domain-containing protein n=1 Tax=Kitasatospora sp. NPDC101176 TaxID=3364099 RepID=UPI00381917F0